MRIVATAALSLLLASPVLAQSALPEQLSAAQQAFGGKLDTYGYADGGYYTKMTADIGGTWIDASPLMTPDMDAAKLADFTTKTCERSPIAIAAPGPFTLTFTLVAGGGLEVTTTYVYVGGMTFIAQVDPNALLTRLGLIDRLQQSPQSAIFAISGVSGYADMYRPGKDVIVVTSPRTLPRFFARCSSTSPVTTGGGGDASAPNATMVAALNKVFDEQLGTVVDKAKRQEFVDCATKVFEPLSAADLKVLIDSDFNPGPEVSNRLDADYPGIQERARACAEAVQVPSTE
jgi:hypothetical protein